MEIIDFGVCRLSLVPVYQKPGAIQVAQLLFGDHYEVLSLNMDKTWMEVRLADDQKMGWIDKKHHHSISPEYFQQITETDYKITTDITATLLYKKSPLNILMGSIVPISQSELFKLDEQFAFNGESKSLAQKRDREFLKTIAYRYLHAPEMEGGKSPFGMDKAMLIVMTYKISGFKLPSDLTQLSTTGRKIKDIPQTGDLAFFKNKEDKISHVGLVLEEHKIIHADGQVKVDYLNEEGILNIETKIYTHSLAFIRRILSD